MSQSPVSEVKSYVVAIRRGARDEVASDWAEQLSQIPGVTIVGRSRYRVLVRATEETIGRMHSIFPGLLIIEEVKERTTTLGSSKQK